MANTYEEYIQDTIKQINSKLRQYLAISGINVLPNDYFSCPNKSNHTHGDSKPSAKILQGTDAEYWFCQVCRHSVGTDTIAIAHLVEGLPLRGPGFISKTIKTLTSKLDIEYNPEKHLSPEQKEIYTMYSANEIVSEYCNNELNKLDSKHPVKQYLKDREITSDMCSRYDIGYGKFEDIVKLLSDKKIPYNLKKEICMANGDTNGQSIFKDNSVIFTLRDHMGKAIGFAARNIDYKKGDANSGPKYINIRNNRIFNKSHYLYNMFMASDEGMRSKRIYIFEGYTDVIRAHNSGIHNCAALCGLGFNENHLMLCDKFNISQIAFCLDSDKAGEQTTFNTIEKLFTNNKSFSPFVVKLPEGEDPDSFIRSKGVEEFKSIKPLNIIKYKIDIMFKKALTNELPDIDEKIEEFFNWLINYEGQPLKRLTCVPILHEYTGILEGDLKKQLNYQEQMMSSETLKTVDNIWWNMLKEGKTAMLQERIKVLDDARHHLISMIGDKELDVSTNMTDSLTGVYEALSSNTITPIKFGWPLFDKNIEIPKDASLTVIGAYPNVGKSILTRSMALGLIQNNPELGVLYFSMDDPKKATVPAMVANLEEILINQIRFPNLIPKDIAKEINAKTKRGFDTLMQWANEGRFAIFDQSDVITLSDMETKTDIVLNYMAKMGKKPVVMIDSIHSVSNPTASSGIRNDIMSIIRNIKRMTNTKLLPAIGVVELRKGGDNTKNAIERRPFLRDISETVDIEYRITVGMILHNPLLVNKESKRHFIDRRWPGTKFPILELHVDKNKEGYFKGELWYKCIPPFSKLKEMSEEEVTTHKSTERSEDNNSGVDTSTKKKGSSGAKW